MIYGNQTFKDKEEEKRENNFAVEVSSVWDKNWIKLINLVPRF